MCRLLSSNSVPAHPRECQLGGAALCTSLWVIVLIGKNIPAKKVWAEVGVYRGDFSRMVLDLCDPAEYHLIDSWTYNFIDHVPFAELTEDYSEFVGKGHEDTFGDDPNATQEGNYRHVLKLFGADEGVSYKGALGR